MSNRSLRATLAVTVLVGVLMEPARAGFVVTNLVTNDQSAHSAQITDPNLKNAWGISRSATSPFWVSANGTGVSTVYSVNPTTDVTAIAPLVVTIQGNGSVTGQAFNGGVGFDGDLFLFVNEDGTVSGWRGALGTTAEVLVTGVPENVYKGATQATIGGESYLYAANFKSGAIDVYKGDSSAPNLTGNFTDPNLPAGYAPFNIQNLDGKLYVSYAQQNADKDEDVPGAGHGIVNVFDLQGNIISRVASTGGPLNSPWGMAIAPASFGAIAGDLLVGNFGDGRINVFDLPTNSFVGQLMDTIGNPLAIDGLCGLIAGNGGSAGSLDRIYFSAGPDDEANGLFGVISGSTTAAVPEPGSIVLALIGAAIVGLRMRRRM